MLRFRFRCSLALFALSGFSAFPATPAITVEQVYCEYAVNPIGMDTPAPRFSWTLTSNVRGQRQSAYRILVATSPEKLAPGSADKWDSGKVNSARAVNVPYGGAPLNSAEKCWWKVQVWPVAGEPSPWSPQATFEMGLLKESVWQADWIGLGNPQPPSQFIPGRFGRGLALDGQSESVRIPHYPALKPAPGITIAAWLKPDQRLGEAWREVYRKEDGNARQLLALGRTGDQTGLWLGLGINGQYVERCGAMDLARLKDGQWHLVAATFDGRTERFYCDGSVIGQAQISGRLDTGGSSPAYLGASGGHDEFFPGGMDDVRLYGRALSAEEIRLLARGGQVAAGLVGWWKLDGDLKNSVAGTDGTLQGKGPPAAPPLLRKEFTIAKPVRRARAYFSGVGWGELYLNGRRVGDHQLDPAATDYDKQVLYVTYDITPLLKQGRNALGIMLGNGWYCEPGVHRYGDSPRARLQLDLVLADGSTARIVTDPSWKSATGPIVADSIYGGEVYDARLERSGWTGPGYDDSDWAGAIRKAAPGGRMVAQGLPPIQVVQTIPPVKFTNPKPGIYVYDFGQLFGGWVRLRGKGPEGTRVTIKYSARLFADTGLLDKRRHRAGEETDTYILKGDPAGEVYEPRFTYHPVRYVQIEGYPGEPTANTLEGRVVHSAIDLAGGFTCSNPLFNQIHTNVLWTFRNGLYGMPLDCLHREHWAWTDPATITGTLYPRKYMPQFWTKWLRDIRAAQRADGAIPDVCPQYQSDRSDPAWGGNYPILVWYLYQYYDDRRLLKEHYPAMKRWIDYLTSIADRHLIRRGHYGDHMLPGTKPGTEQFISRETPPPLVWTGYYYRGAAVLAQVARVLGQPNDAARYARLAAAIQAAFNKEWFHPETAQYATGSQTANALPLALGIVPPGKEPAVVANIVKDIVEVRHTHHHAGNTGTTCLIDTLTRHGQGELLYRIINQTTYPGWGYMVAQGATTIWENWGLVGDAESMVMWLTVDELFYHDLAGLPGPEYYGAETTAPGFAQFDIQPHVLGDLTHASASVRTVHGMISSRWRRTGGALTLEVGIPVNTRAGVNVPTLGWAKVRITEGQRVIWKDGRFVPGQRGITGAQAGDGYVRFEVGSGDYRFDAISNQ